MSIEKPPHLSALLAQIDKLSREDLRALNKYIVHRSKAQEDSRRAEIMAQISPGDLVSFPDKQGNKRTATVLRVNKKTVSLSTLDDERWNVSPEMLTLENHSDDTPATNTPTKVTALNALPTSTPTPIPTSKKTTDIGRIQEWVGGTLAMPAFVTGESGDNYQPSMSVWLNEIGQVVGMALLGPDDPPFDAVASLKQTIANPQAGPAGAPSHLRVSDEKMAAELQRAFPSINVSVGPTPELHTFADAMAKGMPGTAEPQTYSDITSDGILIESFFTSASALYKSKPWKTVPHDQCLIGVTVESLGVTDGALSVIGQMNEYFGIVLFDTLAAHEQYTLINDAVEFDQEPNIPPHRSLSFDKASDVPHNIRKDIARHQWSVADPNAYPTLISPIDGHVLKPLSEIDIELFDIIAQALRAALSEPKFVQALQGHGEHIAEYQILTKKRPAMITLHAPYPYKRVMKEMGVEDDLIAKLLILERANDEEPDWDTHEALTSALLAQYEASPESQSLEIEFRAAALIMEFAFNYGSCTIATISPLVLEEIIFSIIPRKVMIGPEDAADVIQDGRAFLSFLQRAYTMERAGECMEVLDEEAIDRLSDALADPNTFGIGKSVFSSTDPFSSFDPPPLPNPTFGPSATKPKPPDKKSRKKKRAASRKARKKNR